MKNLLKTMCSLLLVLCMVISVLPSVVVSAETGELLNDTKTADNPTELETSPKENSTVSEITPSRNATILQEDISRRKMYEKHFLMSDGSYKVALYSEPVHHMKNGEWVEIDNTLTLQTVSDGTARYSTENGLTDVSFSQNFGDQLVTMQKDNYSVSWDVQAISDNSDTMTGRMDFAQPVRAELADMDMSTLDAEEQKIAAAKSSSSIQYCNALRQGVDLEYIVLPSRIKENIILQNPQDITYYAVNVYTKNLSARLLENRQIEFYNSNNEVLFTMSSPYMYDSAAELSENITVEMTSKGDGCYFIKMTPDAQWLSDESRVYPVVIDPEVSTDTTQQNIIDNYVLEGSGVQNNNLDRLYIGNKSGSTARAYIKFAAMPTIPSGSTITSATMTVQIYAGTSTAYNASAYKVTGGDWASGTITWANKPAAATLLASNISHNNKTRYTFSCKTAVQSWYSGSTTGKNANYGIMLRYYDESINDYNSFYSADYSNESKRPVLTICYEGSGGESGFENASTIALGNSVAVNMTNANELRYFRFTPTVTDYYIIQSSNSSGNPAVWVYNSGYSLIGSDDNSGTGLDFRISIELKANQTYYITTGHTESKIGSYSITVLRSAQIENGFYHIKNLGSSLYLDIHGPSQQVYVHQWSYNTNPQEIWFIQRQSDGYYTIRSQYGNNLYIGISNSNSGEANVQLFSGISNKTRWNIYITNTGRYIFEPINALGKAIYAPDTNIGTEMQLAWMGSGGNYVKWAASMYEYENVLTFSAFDVGDSPEDEVSLVRERLAKLGYKCIGAYSNAEEEISAETIKTIGRYSEIVYINGHGGKYANLLIMDSSGSIKSYLCADDTVISDSYINKVGIGAKFLPNSTTTTNSKWNLKTKWGILAPCSQLDYGSVGAGSHWNGLSSAEVWARTMLGEGERMHGYVGYYSQAPGGSDHIDRLKAFFDACQYDDKSIVRAWGDAHTYLVGSSTWAAIYHSENANDKFQSMTETTTSGSSYKIYYVGRNIGKTELNLASSPPDTLTHSISNDYPQFTNSTITYSATSKENSILNNLRAQLPQTENTIFQAEDNGRITYIAGDNYLGVEDCGYSLTDKEAILAAEQVLNELGILPRDEYRAVVSRTQRVELNSTEQLKKEPETIEYVVSFYRTYNGIDLLSDQQDGIIVKLNKDGLSGLEYLWRDVEFVSNSKALESNAITVEQAQDIYHKQLENDNQIILSKISAENSDIPAFVTTAYVQIDNEVRTVWAFSSDSNYTNCVFVDMYTGEIVTIS